MEISGKIKAAVGRIPKFSRREGLKPKPLSKKDHAEASRIASEMLASAKPSDLWKISGGEQSQESILKMLQLIGAVTKLANPLRKVTKDVKVGPLIIKPFAAGHNKQEEDLFAFSDAKGNHWEVCKTDDGAFVITQKHKLTAREDMQHELTLVPLKGRGAAVAHDLRASRIKRSTLHLN